MKLLVLTLFIAVGFATPVPMDPSGDAVEVVVNGLAEGEALDIGHIVDVKVKDIVDGQVAAVANALHPFTAEGLAEAAAAEEAVVPVIPVPVELPEVPSPEVILPVPVVLPEPVVPVVVPEPIVLPEPDAPVVVPEPIVLPEPVAPVVVPAPIVLPEPIAPVVVLEPIVLPEPATPEIVPEPIVLPEPAIPEVVPEPIVLPEPVAPEVIPEPVAAGPQLNGEIFNDGVVSVTVNAPEDAGVIATLSSWVNLMINYVNSGIAYTQQLI